MNYSQTPASGNSYTHMWDVASMKCFDGGFLVDKTTLPTGTEKLPKGALMKADIVERKATVIKTAVLHEAITTGSTAVKVKKGAMLVATDILGTGTKSVLIGTVDTSNADYDSFAIEAAALGALAKDVVLQTYDAAGSSKNAVNPDGFNAFEVELDAEPSCSVMFKADGIMSGTLPQVLTAAIKAALKFCQIL